jgi:hypothetical protein
MLLLWEGLSNYASIPSSSIVKTDYSPVAYSVGCVEFELPTPMWPAASYLQGDVHVRRHSFTQLKLSVLMWNTKAV